jgi:hypothetical protein
MTESGVYHPWSEAYTLSKIEALKERGFIVVDAKKWKKWFGNENR